MTLGRQLAKQISFLPVHYYSSTGTSTSFKLFLKIWLQNCLIVQVFWKEIVKRVSRIAEYFSVTLLPLLRTTHLPAVSLPLKKQSHCLFFTVRKISLQNWKTNSPTEITLWYKNASDLSNIINKSHFVTKCHLREQRIDLMVLIILNLTDLCWFVLQSARQVLTHPRYSYPFTCLNFVNF